MAPRKLRWIILLLFLVFVIAIPAFLILRKEQMATELEAWLPAHGWKPAACPAGAFGYPDMAEVRCWDGEVAGRQAKLLLGRRWAAETANRPRGSGIAQENYIGVEVEGVDETRIWRGLWEVAIIERHLAEVAASIR